MDNDSHVVQQVASGRLKGIHFSILSDEDAEKISATVIGTVNEVSGAALGLPAVNATECFTCGGRNSKECEGHFGLINFPFTILNPYFMLEVSQILNKICPGCKSVRPKKAVPPSDLELRRNCQYCTGNSRGGYPRMAFRVSSKDIFAKTAIIAEFNEKSSDALASDYWAIIPKDPAAEHSGMPLNMRVLSPAQVYSILKDVCPRTLDSLLRRKNKIFLNSIIVTPNSHRVREFAQQITIDETTRMYRKLFDFRGTPNQLSARVIERYRVSKIRPEKVSNLQKLYEKQSSNESASSASGLRNIKDLVLGKRTDNCLRTVVVGDPKLRVDEIGVPFHIAENVHILDYINPWNWEKLKACCAFMRYRKGCFSVYRNGERITIWSIDKLRTGDAFYRPLIDGDCLLVNRNPSIHQHSLIALSAKILPTKHALSINPLTCSPFRGDFDGDCLHAYVPQSINTQVELRELVSLDKQLLNGQSGRNLLSLSHDSLTAAYLFLENGVLLSKAEMQQLQMFTSCKSVLPSVIQSISKAQFWTSKQLFSLLLPHDFEYDSASNGVYVRQGELVSLSHGSSWLLDSDENLLQCLIQHCGDRALDFLNAGNDILCEWLTKRGLTVSLSDLYLSSDLDSRKNLLEDISYALQKAEELADESLLFVDSNLDFLAEFSEENHKKKNLLKEQMSTTRNTTVELFHASVSASKSALRAMQSLVYGCSSKQNSLIAMLNSGSKGNLQKLVQQSMCLGLQHSLAPVSFSIPRYLSCASWNYDKSRSSVPMTHGSQGTPNYIPCNIISNSFLSGLNPLECFVLSLTSRDGSFGGNAEVSGTLNRRLMFFMRDLIIGYDGTVRNSHGNQVVQFNYCTQETPPCNVDAAMGGHPVGALAACALSEALYSALDQPVSVLESSPLLVLRGVLECGKKNIISKSASLYLSKKLGQLRCGFEYGALEVKNYLECVVLSEIVSDVKICFNRKGNKSTNTGLWASHFHINKEAFKKRHLKMRSVVDTLNKNIPNEFCLQAKSNVCLEFDADKNSDSTLCISVEATPSFQAPEGISELELFRQLAIPTLLNTVVKGFPEFKKVDILWKDDPNQQKLRFQSSGELFLRVVMSKHSDGTKRKHCDGTKFWSFIKDSCLGIRNLIDWERSHPDNISDFSEEYGIDAGWRYFVNSLHSAISETGKSFLPEHLMITANCMTTTGEFVPLTAKGLAQQRKETDSYSPFGQACFANPSDILARAAKLDLNDALQGSLEALSWGQTPAVGTGHRFDIVYSGKGHEPSEPKDVYTLLQSHVKSSKSNNAAKPVTELSCFNTKEGNEFVSEKLSPRFTRVGIKKIAQILSRMLKEYPTNRFLKENDKSIVREVLQYHPRWEDKVGTGILDIKVGCHPDYKENCFFIVRTDGTEEDISYKKCIDHFIELIKPPNTKTNRSKKENGGWVPAAGKG